MRVNIKECWSADGESFNDDCLGDVLDNLASDHEPSELLGMKVYKAEAHVACPTDFFDVDYFIEELGQNACDNMGECAEDWPGCSTEAVKRLEKYINNWLKKEAPCNFWHVKNVQEYVITEDDLN